MALITIDTTSPRIAYTATAAQTLFQVPFSFFDESDLEVYIDDVLQVLTTDYTVTGEGDEGGGTTTFVDALVGGEQVLIVRNIPIERSTSFPSSGPFNIEALNIELTRFIAILQEFDVNRTRALHQPVSDEEEIDALPVAASRASKYLFFDADGQPTVVASVSAAVAATAFMLTLLDDANAAAARATLGITDQSAYIGMFNYLNFR